MPGVQGPAWPNRSPLPPSALSAAQAVVCHPLSRHAFSSQAGSGVGVGERLVAWGWVPGKERTLGMGLPGALCKWAWVSEVLGGILVWSLPFVTGF